VPFYDAKTATCRVFTEKDGLLSRLAHDLELDVTDFTLKADANAVEGTFNPRSLKVVHALKDGRPTDALSDKDKQEIEASLARDVLTSAAPIRFVSTSVEKTPSTTRVVGSLTLNGRARTIELAVRVDAKRFVSEVRLHQPDFGIKPFSAMMGALKIRPEVRVRISIPQWE
jgi:hypothetical protein